MTDNEPKTKQQLLDTFTNPEWRSKLIDIFDLVTYLQQCVIAADYKVPDDIAQTIALSPEGDRVFRELTRDSVPAKEARLLCLLELAHVELLIDVDRFDTMKLANFISDQLLNGSIKLPMAWGPEAYQLAADLFQDERQTLSLSDTFRLLEPLPVGVFQAGHWVSGPWGILRSETRRNLYPIRGVPLQHCHDVTCTRVHSIYLDTASGAAINQNRHKISAILDQVSSDPSEWGAFLSDVLKDEAGRYDDQNLSNLPVLVADCLSRDELATLASRLLDHTAGEFRRSVSQLSKIKDSISWVAALSRAQLLQALWLATDQLIFAAIDALVYDGSIILPDGEVRTSPMRPNASAGAFHVTAELSRHGLRLNGGNALAPLRLRRLVDSLYPSDQVQTQEELDWQLRSVEGMTVGGRLDEYLRTESPASVIAKLVFSGRENTQKACTELMLDPNTAKTDDDLIPRMLWKLGFSVPADEDVRDRFWSSHERASQAARAASVSSIIDEEALRGNVANYFFELERLLDDSLGFATWVLTSDHFRSEVPFSFDEASDRDAAYALLQKYSAGREVDTSHDAIGFGDKNTLYPLSRGFGLLSDLLSRARSDSDAYIRPIDQWPDFSSVTTLQQFPFRHTMVFLDLTPASQADICKLLAEVSAELIGGNVSEVRNEQLHFRRSAADLDRLLGCLSAVESAVRRLDNAGLTRVLYMRRRRESDSWGRSAVFMADRHNREIAFGQPTSYQWLRLPAMHRPQYLVACAQFAEPNQPLRISRASSSEFRQLWRDFPRRPRASARLGGAAASSLPDSTTTAQTFEEVS